LPNKQTNKHCSCHLQGEYVLVGHFWKPYIGQAVGGELDLMVLIGGAEKWAAIQLDLSMCSSTPISTMKSNCLPYIRLPKIPSHCIFTLKMTTAVFAEMLDNSQHSTQHIPKLHCLYLSYWHHIRAI
jgi:hypothetical protein